MLWLTERVARYAIGITMPENYSADAIVAGLVDGLDRVPGHLRKSIAFDQGTEWAKWSEIADGFEMDVWFCEPHSPWQRGQIKNQNRQFRWWFPRGTKLGSIEPAYVDHVAAIVKGQRRRGLDYKSPTELDAAATVQ